jgi:hypothetical protein
MPGTRYSHLAGLMLSAAVAPQQEEGHLHRLIV